MFARDTHDLRRRLYCHTETKRPVSDLVKRYAEWYCLRRSPTNQLRMGVGLSSQTDKRRPVQNSVSRGGDFNFDFRREAATFCFEYLRPVVVNIMNDKAFNLGATGQEETHSLKTDQADVFG